LADYIIKGKARLDGKPFFLIQEPRQRFLRKNLCRGTGSLSLTVILARIFLHSSSAINLSLQITMIEEVRINRLNITCFINDAGIIGRAGDPFASGLNRAGLFFDPYFRN